MIEVAFIGPQSIAVRIKATFFLLSLNLYSGIGNTPFPAISYNQKITFRTAPAGTLYTNFRLNASGEDLALFRPDMSFAFDESYPSQYTDISYDITGSEFQYIKLSHPGSLNIEGEGICIISILNYFL